MKTLCNVKLECGHLLYIQWQPLLAFSQRHCTDREKYNLPLEERYNFILNKIIEEEKLYLYKNEEKFIVNAEKMAMKNLEIFINMNFEEMDFYVFYVDYLSKKEYEDKKVLVGFNGIDGKEVTISKLKDDINKIRDSKGTFI